MSRARDARHKAKRQQAGVAAKPKRRARPLPWLRLVAPVVTIAVIAIIATVSVLGSTSSRKAQVPQEVTALLAGIPQEGATLGKPKAPVTLRVFADLECHTVRRFVMFHLPSIINGWVRRGIIKLEYRSLETDTLNEHIFFRQETAAVAAGRQDKMWNFIETFVHEQGKEYTDYATEQFLAGIASQVPGLGRPRWSHDLKDPLLFKRVADGVHRAHLEDMHGTPSFLIGLTGSQSYQRIGPRTEPGPLPDAASLSDPVARLTNGRWGVESIYRKKG